MKNLRAAPLLCLMVFGVPLSSFARDREVSASGSCTKISTPDRGQITLVAEAQDKDLQVAAKRATEQYERASQAIKKLGLEHLDLRTVEYSLNEVREWEKNKMVPKGFKARMGLQVSTSSIQKLGDVIAIAANEKLQDVSGLTTFLSPEKLRLEQFSCLQAASNDAREKAQKLAESLGAKLGEVITVRPMMAMADGAMMSKSAVAAPSIDAGQQELHVNVDAVFSLK